MIFQFSRRLQIFLQKADKEEKTTWRPSIIAASGATFTRLGAFDLLRWLSQKYGFGTYIHTIDGYLSHDTSDESAEIKERIIRMAETTDSRIYVDTIISPSYTSAIAQIVQFPGIAGTENNLLLLEYSKANGEGLSDIIDNFKLIKSVNFNVGILSISRAWLWPETQHSHLDHQSALRKRQPDDPAGLRPDRPPGLGPGRDQIVCRI